MGIINANMWENLWSSCQGVAEYVDNWWQHSAKFVDKLWTLSPFSPCGENLYVLQYVLLKKNRIDRRRTLQHIHIYLYMLFSVGVASQYAMIIFIAVGVFISVVIMIMGIEIISNQRRPHRPNTFAIVVVDYLFERPHHHHQQQQHQHHLCVVVYFYVCVPPLLFSSSLFLFD